LQLRVISPAGAFISVSPGVVEDIFAIAVHLQIGGQGGFDDAV
jgi:uncharacterized membrane protein AbrB (regulator of aidB expression)